MATTKKQRIAMALIAVVGLLGGAAVLMPREAPGDHAEGEAHGEHAEGEAHGDEAKAAAGHDERRIALTEAQAQAAGLAVEAAGPATLRSTVRFAGEIRLDEDRTSHVVPRLAGIATAVPAALGQRVRKGEVLAVVASPALADLRSESLTAQKRREAARLVHDREKTLWEGGISARQDYQQAQSALEEADIAVRNASQKLAAVGAAAGSSALNRFEIRAPFAGTVVEKHLALGEAVKEDASIFTVADLGTVWAEFAVAPKDLGAVRVGQRVTVSSTAFDETVEGTVAYVGALIGEQTRSARARVVLQNPQGAWRPGLFVTVAVEGEGQAAPLTVPADAVQTMGDETLVFEAVADGFVATPVKTGRSDGRRVEVVAGLRPGARVASSNTFVLKSELGKNSAGHGH